MLCDALIPSLEEVGARFERGDYFVPEMLIAARARQGALDILRPLVAESGAKPMGKFLIGDLAAIDQVWALAGLAAQLGIRIVRDPAVALLLRRLGVGPDRGSTNTSCARPGVSAEPSPSPF